MHFPGHMRQAFVDWVEAGQPDVAQVEVDYVPRPWPAEKLLGRLCHCSDVMPSDLCGDLDMRLGSSYARAAQSLLAERRLVH